MSRASKIGVGILIVFIAIQFIRPARNESAEVLPTDITHVVAVPDSVLSVIKMACYDCHSNHTVYPWYMNVQPVAWFMSSHIKDGKSKLNFSDFGSYPKEKQSKKLKGIAKEVKSGGMPISSYTLMHANARLSQEQKDLIVGWADSLAAKE